MKDNCKNSRLIPTEKVHDGQDIFAVGREGYIPLSVRIRGVSTDLRFVTLTSHLISYCLDYLVTKSPNEYAAGRVEVNCQVYNRMVSKVSFYYGENNKSSYKSQSF